MTVKVTVEREPQNVLEKTFENVTVKHVAKEMAQAVWIRNTDGSLDGVIVTLMSVADDATSVRVEYNGANMFIRVVE